MDYRAGDDARVTEIVIDASGAVSFVRLADKDQESVFKADGEYHNLGLKDDQGNPWPSRYRCFGGCARDHTEVAINARIEWYVPFPTANDSELAHYLEFRFAGRFKEPPGSIKGKLTYEMEGGAIVVHPLRTRSFEMQRVGPPEYPKDTSPEEIGNP